MKRQIYLLVVAVTISYIVFSFITIRAIRNREYIQNTIVKIELLDKKNTFYTLERHDIYKSDEDASLYVHEKGSEGDRRTFLCDDITELAKYEDYIIGYSNGKKTEQCKGYFYINRRFFDYNLNAYTVDTKFNLSKEKVEEKFGKSVKYQNSIKYIKEYGEGSDSYENIDEIIYFHKFLGIIAAIILYILYNLISLIVIALKKK